MSFKQLFIANLKMLYRNWRGLFWNVILPVALYVGLSMLNLKSFGASDAGASNINYSDYLLPGILAMTIMQTGIFGLSYWLIDLKERGVIKRFRVTPLSNTELIGSLVLSRLIVMFVQIIILTTIGVLFFNVHFHGSVLAVLLLAMFGGSIFLTLGFLISTLARTYDEAAPITTILNLLFTFLGNVFFPTATLPHLLREVGNVIPLSYLADGLRQNFLHNISIWDVRRDLFALIIWLVIIFVITAYLFKKQEQYE